VKQVLREAFLIALAGAMMAFAANALSPRGLKLNRDYFPGGPKEDLSPPSPRSTLTAGTTDSPSNAWHLLEARLAEKGLRLINKEQTTALYSDPRKLQDQVIFIDDRDDSHYAAGHIPGALQFDHYHAEKYLGTMLPACQNAAEIVVYCNGGECEDSEYTATMLGEAGIAKEKLRVYGGGITEWTKAGLPLEKGARNSGEMVPPAK
jgi:rhodanese-related sulfurtransferase